MYSHKKRSLETNLNQNSMKFLILINSLDQTCIVPILEFGMFISIQLDHVSLILITEREQLRTSLTSHLFCMMKTGQPNGEQHIWEATTQDFHTIMRLTWVLILSSITLKSRELETGTCSTWTLIWR